LAKGDAYPSAVRCRTKVLLLILASVSQIRSPSSQQSGWVVHGLPQGPCYHMHWHGWYEGSNNGEEGEISLRCSCTYTHLFMSIMRWALSTFFYSRPALITQVAIIFFPTSNHIDQLRNELRVVSSTAAPIQKHRYDSLSRRTTARE
jgi:hypothetical protein